MGYDVNDAFPRETVTLKNGKQLVLTLQTFATEADFKEYLEREAVAGFLRKADMMPDAMLDRAMAALGRAFAARAYAWKGPAWWDCMRDTENSKQMFWYLIRQVGEDGKTRLNEWPSHREQMDAIWKEAGPQLIAAWERLNDPNAGAPPAPEKQPAA